MSELALAKHQITILRAMATLHEHLPATDVVPLLSMELVAKRRDISNDMPRQLYCKNYKAIVTTLRALDNKSIEYQDCCELINDHLEVLLDANRIQGRPRNLKEMTMAGFGCVIG
eukprot:TRINITY_DN12152_c0_g1_i1.p1 TRINITY_DN12152_c0_g1~~TRINITY_DN12152_c0_g1_i1.p1  ORF type:complete len:115 (-),score=14.08 TRINITY_DN12152_c0_g1_i1:74-418(-)